MHSRLPIWDSYRPLDVREIDALLPGRAPLFSKDALVGFRTRSDIAPERLRHRRASGLQAFGREVQLDGPSTFVFRERHVKTPE